MQFTDREFKEYFKKWGAASGCYTCPISSLNERQDIVQVAQIGLARALSEFDPTKSTKDGKPVDLATWCIIVMRSHVNNLKYGQVWKKENTFVRDQEFNDLLQTVFYGTTDGIYQSLVSLVENSLYKQSSLKGTVFTLRFKLGLDPKEIAKVVKKKKEDVQRILEGFRPVILYYHRTLVS